MKSKLLLCAVCGLAVMRQFAAQLPEELHFTGDSLEANRQTGSIHAEGNISATALPYRFRSDYVDRTASGVYDLGDKATLTTCTNDWEHVHWHMTGKFGMHEKRSVEASNAFLHLWGVPVFYMPFWYYPLNTDYGWRAMPGYTSKWGGYLLTGYVYDILNENDPDSYHSLGGSTYADFRTENGFAVGQTIRWNLGDYGRGRIGGYYAWDEDYDHYSDHWNSRRHNYKNWGSEVDRERYRLVLDHAADFTERDSLRVHAQYLSDSHFLYDFFDKDNRFESIPANEASYEHRENSYAGGVSVSGPVNDFYGGTARLPEGFFMIEPQPLFGLPINFESSSRAGYLNRDYAAYGSDDPVFHYNPYLGANGKGADYQAFRADSHNRVSIPFKLWDTLSLVPRAGYRATYWSDSGNPDAYYCSASGDAMYRGIAEVGITASSRATAYINQNWQHVFEPYIDYSFQRVDYGTGSRNRNYIFDNYDGSVDWLDQFGFEGRGLPYDWHGVRPGIRNVFRERGENGISRTVADIDVYAAVPFEDESYYREGTLAGYPKKQENGHYSRTDCVVPGIRAKYKPTRDITLSTRTELDLDDEKVGYSDVFFRHRLTKDFTWNLGYIARDHRIWDYLPSELDRWNYELSNIASLGFEYQICDRFAISPFVRYDCRLDEIDEVGTWFDILTDCLGFRFIVEYENSYDRIDGSHCSEDYRFGFFIYLRCIGPSAFADLARF